MLLFLEKANARQRGTSAGEVLQSQASRKGKVQDETGNVLTPTHVSRDENRQWHYVSNRLVSGGTDPTVS